MAHKSQLAAPSKSVGQSFGFNAGKDCSSRTDWAPAHEVTLPDLIHASLAVAREVRARLADQIVPALPPGKRAFALSLAAGLGSSDIFNERVVADLEAFAGFINQQVELGRKVGWEAEECHVDGG